MKEQYRVAYQAVARKEADLMEGLLRGLGVAFQENVSLRWDGTVDVSVSTPATDPRRDMFAAAALTGLRGDPQDVARRAVELADAVLAALDGKIEQEGK